jgi:hypothetical protein
MSAYAELWNSIVLPVRFSNHATSYRIPHREQHLDWGFISKKKLG